MAITIPAKDVMKLREQTGAGMMDCKNALIEAEGDFEKAAEILRERGIAKATKRASKVAAEGIVYALVENGVGVLVEVNCESDFVANGEKFREVVAQVAKTIAAVKPCCVDKLLVADMGDGKTVESFIQEQTGVIGEKLSVRRFALYESNGLIETYIHMGGTQGIMLDLDCPVNDVTKELAHNLALHAMFTKPAYLSPAEVSAEAIEKEREILKQEVLNDEKNAGKPEAVIDRIVEGKIKKFYEDNCLLEQKFIKDDKITIKQLIAQTAKEAGAPIELKGYVFYIRGEGIEKKAEDLSEEVAKQVEAMKK